MAVESSAGAIAAPSPAWRSRTLRTALAVHLLLPLLGNLFDLAWQLAVSLPLVGAYGAGLITGAASVAWNGIQLGMHAATFVLLLGLVRASGDRRASGAAVALTAAGLSAATAVGTIAALIAVARRLESASVQPERTPWGWMSGVAASWEHLVLAVAWVAVAAALARADAADDAPAGAISGGASAWDGVRVLQATLAVPVAVVEVVVGVAAAIVAMPSWTNGQADSAIRASAALGSVAHAAMAPAQLLLFFAAIAIGRALSSRAELAGRTVALVGVAATLAAGLFQFAIYAAAAIASARAETVFVWGGLAALAMTRQVLLTAPWWPALAAADTPTPAVVPASAALRTRFAAWLAADDRRRLAQLGLSLALAVAEVAVFCGLVAASMRAEDGGSIVIELALLSGLRVALLPVEAVLLVFAVLVARAVSERREAGRPAAWAVGGTLAVGASMTMVWVPFALDHWRLGIEVWPLGVMMAGTFARHVVLAAPWLGRRG